MHRIAILAAVLACTACEPEPGPIEIAPSPVEPQTAQAQSQPDCHAFTAPVMVADTLRQTNGQVCQEPDGGWRVVQQTPGLPVQEYRLPPPGQEPAAAAPPLAAGQPGCHDYTIALTVGGQPEQATLQACPQPDGSWRVTQNTPGLPPQTYVMPPPPPLPQDNPYAAAYPDYADPGYADYFDFDPYWADEPWVFGLGPTLVVVYGFHHFDHGYAGGSHGGGGLRYDDGGFRHGGGGAGSGFQHTGGFGGGRGGGWGGGGWGGGRR